MAFKRSKKRCEMSINKVGYVDYKDMSLIGKYVTDKGKILPGKVTGLCTAYQRKLTTAIKRARHMALIPFVSR